MSRTVSVIIPTYNRSTALRRALESLCKQSLSAEDYEVVVVDDGSTDDTAALVQEKFPFALRYVRQDNLGATEARNAGAWLSAGAVLVFMDDDVTISPDTLEVVSHEFRHRDKSILMAAILNRSPDPDSIYARVLLQSANGHKPLEAAVEEVDFTKCNTECLCVKRDDFFTLGLFQDPSGGWPNWDDVDFGFRAHQSGYKLLQVSGAVAEHWDYSLVDFQTACRRWELASKAAVKLFQTHPDLRAHLPMFSDKIPVDFSKDAPGMVLRKLLRRIASSLPVLASMQLVVRALERGFPAPGLLRPLYRWVTGAYLSRGFRAGLSQYGAIQ